VTIVPPRWSGGYHNLQVTSAGDADLVERTTSSLPFCSTRAIRRHIGITWKVVTVAFGRHISMGDGYTFMDLIPERNAARGNASRSPHVS